MFTEKERLNLIMSYGLEESIDLYNRYKDEISYVEFKRFKSNMSIQYDLPQKLADAIYFIEYHYKHRGQHFDEIMDFFNTLRAIERQVI
ncbi:hypothetical protein ROU88_10190 [Macrococcus capreoli]|uniref:hypothetical protein n=1 Tax=Macrococcus capreoli TaxID=2982690 RepID=UPI0021D57583|nr:hypothetical protein [Macrococcus sp. TMW 2.2395]MCU7558142.1 hypothetical protein [Macrococcus sp. TMW 2.2395]